MGTATALFLSTLSLRRATATKYPQKTGRILFLSTLSLRRATHIMYNSWFAHADFYPRSPCGERPCYARFFQLFRRQISIHALLAESDPSLILIWLYAILFLSTLSLRRATYPKRVNLYNDSNFYPRSPCGERRGCQQPCERPTTDFYPRSPCGERRLNLPSSPIDKNISIHALLAECDGCVRYCIHARVISIHALLAESDSSTQCRL